VTCTGGERGSVEPEDGPPEIVENMAEIRAAEMARRARSSRATRPARSSTTACPRATPVPPLQEGLASRLVIRREGRPRVALDEGVPAARRHPTYDEKVATRTRNHICATKNVDRGGVRRGSDRRSPAPATRGKP